MFIYTYREIILHYNPLYPLGDFFNFSSSTLWDVSGGGTPVDIRISQQQSGTGARPSFDDICRQKDAGKKGCLGTSHMMQHMHSQFWQQGFLSVFEFISIAKEHMETHNG